MKRLILVSAVWFGFCLCACADDNGFVKGEFWLKLSITEKLMYRSGVKDLFWAAGVSALAHHPVGECLDMLDDFNLVPTGLSMQDVIASLDTFFANPANIKVPVLFVFKWVKLRNGPERDAEAARLRSAWPNDGKSK